MATVYNVACYGDSITEGAFGNVRDGGIGNWVEQWRGFFTNATSAPPIIGTGFRGMWKSFALAENSDAAGNSTDEWTVSSAADWTHTTATASYNKCPHGELFEGGGGSTKTATWHAHPTLPPIVGFAIHYVDGPSSGNWQYSIDGGAWTNMGQSNVQDGNLKKFAVMSSVTSTVSIRQFDGSGNATVYLCGIEAYFADPRTTNGTIFHNIGRFGYWLQVSTGALNGGGDPFAWFDSVTLGSNAVSHTPVLATLEFVNDQVIINNTTTWTTDLGTFWTRVNANLSIPWVLVNMWEMIPGSGSSTTNQSNYRTASTTFASGKSSLFLLDMFNYMQSSTTYDMGGVGSQGTNLFAAGYSGDGTHPSATGNTIFAQQLFKQTKAAYIETPFYVAVHADTLNQFTIGGSQVGSTDTLAGRPGAWSFTVPATPQPNTQTPSIVKSAGKNVSVTQTQTPSFVKSAGKVLTFVETQTASFVKSAGKFLTVTQTQTPSFAASRAFLQALSAAQSQAASMIHGAGKLMSVVQTQAPTFSKSVGKFVTVTQTQVPAVLKGLAVRLTAGESQTSNLTATFTGIIGGIRHLTVTFRNDQRVTQK